MVDNYYGDYSLKMFHKRNRLGKRIKTSILKELLDDSSETDNVEL